MNSNQEHIIMGAGQGIGRSMTKEMADDLETLKALAKETEEERHLRKLHESSWFHQFCTVKEPESAVDMLEEAAECIGDRASERDTEEERSMAATVRAFNGMFGTKLTEEQGWHFMALLKMARAKGGDYRRDDYVDGAAYFALAGECRGND